MRESESKDRLTLAIQLMSEFAARTGLTSDRTPQRYLWTDAFAVCNYVGLARATEESSYLDLARRLVRQVHTVLGRHRDDDPRSGWISGLGEAEGAAHPTRGGLRIGKPLPERSADERYDDRLEWDRDGQYFHYLTKWMHALDLMARTTGESDYATWSRELAAVALAAFTVISQGSQRPRMVWKMSIDLSRPLVPSMGHHDPLDGYLTCRQLQSTASMGAQSDSTYPKPLEDEAAVLRAMIARRDWTTDDPLGLGGLLMDAFRFQQLIRVGDAADYRLLESLLTAARRGLEIVEHSAILERSVTWRLAFRELGLAIGLAAAEQLGAVFEEISGLFPAPSPGFGQLAKLERYQPLRDRIVSFWLEPEHQMVESFTEHRDINEVMLASALAPEGCLVLPVS